ncbi:flagellar export protein FliJ [Paenibacillus sp. JX-17]|uniref:Flagellar FliJ protein n=1 Tax=Paenibacillus lacisoli TaxID=3064525 RepID=A0ABT9CCX8_9BACL|nr:flagellar export protein FliJ [Paenibacillus sp. JX-17]MDO7905832.1 flagellar export protein FliJ [Paenibacillus sp. JX-17]
MRFHYSFQKVVDLKTNEKAQAEWMLSTAVGQLQLEEQTLQQLMSEKSRMEHMIQQAATGCVSLLKLQEMQAYIEHLNQCISQKYSDVQRAELNVQKNKDHLTDKIVDEKVWLKAREKARISFQQELLLREQNELDEMATIRYAMRAR